jgi:hypothetical protein
MCRFLPTSRRKTPPRIQLHSNKKKAPKHLNSERLYQQLHHPEGSSAPIWPISSPSPEKWIAPIPHAGVVHIKKGGWIQDSGKFWRGAMEESACPWRGMTLRKRQRLFFVPIGPLGMDAELGSTWLDLF